MADNPSRVDFQGGLVKICLPDTPARKGCFIAGFVIVIIGIGAFSIGHSYPDIGLVDDAQTWNSIDTELDSGTLGAGIEGEGAWVLSHIWLQDGHLGTFTCSAEYTEFKPNYSDNLQFSFVDDSEYTYYSAKTDSSLGLNVDWANDYCGDWTVDTFSIEGTNETMWRLIAHMLIYHDSKGDIEDILIVSVWMPDEEDGFDEAVEWGLLPLDDFTREITLRTGLGLFVLGMTFVVFSTPKPLEYVLRKFQRSGERDILDIEFDEEGRRKLVSVNELTRKVDENDWIFEPPSPKTWNLDDPYLPDENETLIDEHPSLNGVFNPPFVTNRSFFIVIWWIAAVKLCHEFLFMDNDPLFVPIMSIIFLATVGITLINYVPNSFRTWRRFHALKDLPTSTVRGAAVGPVELVGQVRPSPSGAAKITVNGRTFSGIVAWRILTAGPNGMRIIAGSKPFVLHDGTGGVLVDPSTWFWGESDSINGSEGNVKFLFSELQLGRSLSGVPLAESFKFELDMDESYRQDHTKVLRAKHPGGISRFMMELLHGSELKGKKGLLGKLANRLVNVEEIQRQYESEIENAEHAYESGMITETDLKKVRSRDMDGEFSELYALAIGDPVYVLGTARPRSAEDVEEGVSTANQSSLLVVTGDEAPGIFPRIDRGSELTTSKELRSDFESLVPPFVATAMVILLFLL